LNHDENACFEQFIDKIVKTSDFIKDESLDDRKSFRLRNARRTLDRMKIKASRNVDQIN
jgi:hypothetical protein